MPGYTSPSLSAETASRNSHTFVWWSSQDYTPWSWYRSWSRGPEAGLSPHNHSHHTWGWRQTLSKQRPTEHNIHKINIHKHTELIQPLTWYQTCSGCSSRWPCAAYWCPRPCVLPWCCRSGCRPFGTSHPASGQHQDTVGWLKSSRDPPSCNPENGHN